MRVDFSRTFLRMGISVPVLARYQGSAQDPGAICRPCSGLLMGRNPCKQHQPWFHMVGGGRRKKSEVGLLWTGNRSPHSCQTSSLFRN